MERRLNGLKMLLFNALGLQLKPEPEISMLAIHSII